MSVRYFEVIIRFLDEESNKWYRRVFGTYDLTILGYLQRNSPTSYLKVYRHTKNHINKFKKRKFSSTFDKLLKIGAIDSTQTHSKYFITPIGVLFLQILEILQLVLKEPKGNLNKFDHISFNANIKLIKTIKPIKVEE